MPGNGNSGGHNKKSTALHVVQGTFRAHRHGDHETPDPPQGLPSKPKSLSALAGAEWDRMVERLEKTGALSTVDDAALYQYCELYAETEQIKRDNLNTRKLAAALKKEAFSKLEGDSLVDAIDKIVKLQFLINKETQQLRQGHMAVRQYLVEFGMTPSARSRVKLPKGKQPSNSNKERFFGGAGNRNA